MIALRAAAVALKTNGRTVAYLASLGADPAALLARAVARGTIAAALAYGAIFNVGLLHRARSSSSGMGFVFLHLPPGCAIDGPRERLHGLLHTARDAADDRPRA